MKWIFSRLGYVWAALTAPKGQRRPQPPGSQPTPVSESQEQPGARATPISRPQLSMAPKAAAPKKQTPAQKTPTERRSLRRYERTLIVGVDFGTSSTKVVWQDLSENYFELFRWRPDLKGLESVLLPSTICVRADALVFGNSAPGKGDFWLPSIKLCMLCRRNPSVCRCDGSIAKCGEIQLPGTQAPVPAAALGCLFLAHVFQQVEQRLMQTFPNDDIVLIWNIGCPMDHLDVVDSKSSWEKMAGVAMQLRGRVPIRRK